MGHNGRSRLTVAEILPHCVASFEVYGDMEDAVLFPEELAMVAAASASRRRTFATARACARRALSELGLDPVAILVDVGGAPCWPTGIIGSITHCAGYRAAAVAQSGTLLCIGIDAEPNENLSPRVLERIALVEEQEAVHELLSSRPQIAWDRLLFSIKETVYKAWWSANRRALGFHDVMVGFDPAASGFEARLGASAPGMPSSMSGKWTLDGDLLLTAVGVGRPDQG